MMETVAVLIGFTIAVICLWGAIARIATLEKLPLIRPLTDDDRELLQHLLSLAGIGLTVAAFGWLAMKHGWLAALGIFLVWCFGLPVVCGLLYGSFKRESDRRGGGAEELFKEMPDDPVAFTQWLCRRPSWRQIDPQLLRQVAENAKGEMELLRRFVFVSEQYRLVSDNFVELGRNQELNLRSPLSCFALTLYRLGSSLCQEAPSMRNHPEQLEMALMSADMAFTSAILCDRFQLQAYAGMAALYGQININKPVALEWCQKYREAKDALAATPDDQLTPLQQAAKRVAQRGADEAELIGEMDEQIKELEHRLSGSE